MAYESGQWWVRDLDGSNGVFVAGEKIQKVTVDGELTFTLGIAGPAVQSHWRPNPRARIR